MPYRMNKNKEGEYEFQTIEVENLGMYLLDSTDFDRS